MQHLPARTFETAPRLLNERSKKAEYSFFEGTSVKFMQAIAKLLEKERFEKQDYLFKEGDVGFNMYLISSGSVITTKGTNLCDVEIHRRGSHCGELAIFGCSRRNSSAIAREHTECLVLKNRVFQAVLERFPEEKEYFNLLAMRVKDEVRHPRQRKAGRNRPRKAWGKGDAGSSDSDCDATDDPAPIMPSDEAAPLPDTEIPGAYPALRKMQLLDLRKPIRNGPDQLVPLAPAKLPEGPESRYHQARMGKELATVGRSAFMRKMAVAEALSQEMAGGSHSMRPSTPAVWKEKKTVEEDSFGRQVSKDSFVRQASKGSRPPVVNKALEEDFDVNFDLNVNLNAVDPWRRAVSA